MFTLAEVQSVADENGIVNGILGGLVLGNSHVDGGIKVIRQYREEKLYEIIAELEGWEYVLNPATTQKELDHLNQLNSEFATMKELFKPFEIPDGIDIIDARPVIENRKDTSRLILFSEYSQFIVNKYSTKKYLTELDLVNKKYGR